MAILIKLIREIQNTLFLEKGAKRDLEKENHGTAVAGVVVQNGPKNVKILNIKVADLYSELLQFLLKHQQYIIYRFYFTFKIHLCRSEFKKEVTNFLTNNSQILLLGACHHTSLKIPSV